MEGLSEKYRSIASEFVRQYYTVLSKQPQDAFRFYGTDSSFVHGGFKEENCASPVFGSDAIRRRLDTLDLKDCHTVVQFVDTTTIDEQTIFILVSGERSLSDGKQCRFTESFILRSSSADKFYVRSNIYRCLSMNEPPLLTASSKESTPGVTAPAPAATTIANTNSDIGGQPPPPPLPPPASAQLTNPSGTINELPPPPATVSTTSMSESDLNSSGEQITGGRLQVSSTPQPPPLTSPDAPLPNQAPKPRAPPPSEQQAAPQQCRSWADAVHNTNPTSPTSGPPPTPPTGPASQLPPSLLDQPGGEPQSPYLPHENVNPSQVNLGDKSTFNQNVPRMTSGVSDSVLSHDSDGSDRFAGDNSNNALPQHYKGGHDGGGGHRPTFNGRPPQGGRGGMGGGGGNRPHYQQRQHMNYPGGGGGGGGERGGYRQQRPNMQSNAGGYQNRQGGTGGGGGGGQGGGFQRGGLGGGRGGGGGRPPHLGGGEGPRGGQQPNYNRHHQQRNNNMNTIPYNNNTSHPPNSQQPK